MQFRSITLAAAAFAMAAPAALHAQADDNYTQVRSFDEASLRAALEPQGHTLTRQETDDKSYYLVEYDGLNVIAVPTSCLDDGRCVGLYISIPYTKPDALTAAQVAERAMAFNLQFDFIKVVQFTSGDPALVRYTIADYGTNLGNIREEFSNTVSLARRFDEEQLSR